MTVLLDTPNLWRGQAIAGTPARIVGLMAALRRAGAEVSIVLCDRGMGESEWRAWPFAGLLVHPSVFYGPVTGLVGFLRDLAPDILIVTDAELVVAAGAAAARAVGARLVYEAHDDEAALSASLGAEAESTARREAWQRAAAEAADHVVVLTAREAAVMHRYGVSAERLLVLPTGVDLASRRACGPLPSERRLLFLGNLFYEPNIRAVAFLMDLVADLRAAGRAVRVRIVGRGPAGVTRPSEGLAFTGPVMDLHAAFRSVSLAVAPLTAGSGLKVKVLDYMAAGLPVLATAEAVAGLPSHHPVMVCDDLSAWPAVVDRLLADRACLHAQGAAGRAFVERHHDWDVLAARVLARFRQWCSLSQPPRRVIAAPRGAGEPLWLAEHSRHNALRNPHLTKNRPVVVSAIRRVT